MNLSLVVEEKGCTPGGKDRRSCTPHLQRAQSGSRQSGQYGRPMAHTKILVEKGSNGEEWKATKESGTEANDKMTKVGVGS